MIHPVSECQLLIEYFEELDQGWSPMARDPMGNSMAKIGRFRELDRFTGLRSVAKR